MSQGWPLYLLVCFLAAMPLLYPPFGVPAVLALGLIWLATPVWGRG